MDGAPHVTSIDYQHPKGNDLMNLRLDARSSEPKPDPVGTFLREFHPLQHNHHQGSPQFILSSSS